MTTPPDTIDDPTVRSLEHSGALVPGIVVVHSGDRAQWIVLPLTDAALEIGRDELAAAGIPDGRVSRQHLRIALEEGQWSLRDHDSRNGTFVDGRAIRALRRSTQPVVRIGHTILLPVHDVRPYQTPGLQTRDGVVMGPMLQTVHERIAMIARSGSNLLVLGASGAGKEIAARSFHAASGAESRPFVAINCATIQHDLAERILFGARKGAYTGAASDAVGLVQAADGGTLFLDEIAELSPAVQAKLLRVIETRTLTPLGAVHPVRVDIRLCAATLKDLRGEVSAGRFREDLYFRLGRPEVRIPLLSERREEIPWVIQHGVDGFVNDAATVRPGAEFVAACMIRQWPGNVRELLSETRTAALAAVTRKRNVIAVNDLDDNAGCSLRVSSTAPTDDDLDDEKDPTESAKSATSTPVDPAVVEAALRAEQGNVLRAATRLGISRGKVRRIIERLQIDVKALRGE